MSPFWHVLGQASLNARHLAEAQRACPTAPTAADRPTDVAAYYATLSSGSAGEAPQQLPPARRNSDAAAAAAAADDDNDERLCAQRYLSFPDMESSDPSRAWHATERRYPRQPAAAGVLTCLWSVAELPLRSATVDAVVVDLPFGMVHKVGGGTSGLRTLYGKALAEVHCLHAADLPARSLPTRGHPLPALSLLRARLEA